MFRALYAFNSCDPGTLNANCDDLFCGICMDKSGLWIQVADDSGGVGYLPFNYVQLCSWAERDFSIQFIDDGIQRIHEKASVAGSYTNIQLEKLRVLNTHREKLTNHYDQHIAFIKGSINGQTTGTASSQRRVVHSKSTAYSANTAGQLASHSKQPTNTAGQLASHSKQPTNRAGQLASHSKQPTNTAGQLASHSKQPTNTAGQLASHSKQSTNTAGQLASHSKQPTNTAGQLASHSKQPTNTAGQLASHSNWATNIAGQLASHSNWATNNTKQVPETAFDDQKNTSKDNECADVVQNPSESTNPRLEAGQDSTDKARACGDGSNAKLISKSLSADTAAAQMTELLRDSTGLSYDKCKTGIAALLEYLISHNVSPNQLPLICTAVEQDVPGKSCNQELSHDIIEMNSIFSTIAECKDDSQQRSWNLYEDEGFISNKLSRLLEILTMGNRDALVENISNDLDCVHNLVLYYQMETRSSLRAIMLQIFAALCTMSSIFITNLLCSVLTLELVRDLMSTKDNQRLQYSAIVLSMLFSTGEPIPVQHSDLLSNSFVDFLLDKIEESSDVGIADVCLELLLSFNQHFEDAANNTVLLQLSHRQEATVLTQNFLKLFNSGEDPVRIIAEEEQMNAVLKFAIDLYSVQATSQLIYTNDVKVLIDIIIRQLTDLSDEDKVRTDYLSLMQLLLINSNYSEHNHRKEDLISALNQIEFNEEATTSQSEMDVRIVQEIRKVL